MKEKILVVEDDASLSENLKAFLTFRGYSVRCAADGPQALEATRKEPPDLMLLDLVLPGMGGFDVLRALRSEPLMRSVKVIVITGLSRMGDVETAFACGANDYVVKPFNTDRLLEKVQKVLASA